MNPDYKIYSSLNVSPEDKARLDGYLKGREEGDVKAELDRMRDEMRKLESEIERRSPDA